jgi:hypothetical protein
MLIIQTNTDNNAMDYVKDIYQHFRSAECKYQIDPDYITRQSDINEEMRATLIDWLVKVHLNFKLMTETMYLTVNVLDRFLDKKNVHRSRLQLIGCTAMLIASKYEEIYPPEIQDFVYISDKAFTRDEVLDMEVQIINTLSFNLTVPTAYHFLNHFMKAARAEFGSQFKQMCRYYAERTLQEISFVKYKPSMVAASAVSLAIKATNAAWTPKLVEEHTTYTEHDLLDCIKNIEQTIEKGDQKGLEAVKKKYGSAAAHCKNY